MASRSKRRRPLGWARVLSPQRKEDEEVSVEEEEAFLRTRAYHAASRRLDAAMTDALVEMVAKPMEDALQALLSLVTPQESILGEENSPIATTNAANAPQPEPSTDENLILEPPQRYNPLLLPILTTVGPPSLLDRHEWMKHMVQAVQRARPRTAVVWLRAATGLDGDWLPEIVRQCLRQEPDVTNIVAEARKGSLTDILTWWASTTTAFDNIVVAVDAMDIGEDWDGLVVWLAHRRAWQGIPVSLLVLQPVAGLSPLAVADYGPVGVSVRRVAALPAPEVLWRSVQERAMETIALVPEAVWEQAHWLMEQETRSVVGAILELKRGLAEALCEPGSFLVAGEHLLAEEVDRMRWFLLHPTGREIVSGKLTEKPALIQWCRKVTTKRAEMSLVMQVERLMGTNQLFLEVMKAIMNFLLENRDKNESFVNRLIVMLDHCSSLDEISLTLQPIKDDWTSTLSLHHDIPSSWSPPEPRRNTVAGLLQEVEISKNGAIPNLAGALYYLMSPDRVSIAQDEWFTLFYQQFAAHMDLQPSFTLFICGVRFLTLHGLIKARKSPAVGGTVYDKTALVWCGGD